MIRLSGPNRALFASFLGDIVREHIGLKILSWKKVGSEARDKLWDEITRYFDVDFTYRKLIMKPLGGLLRNFRRKLRQTYILPNQIAPSKLNEVPKKYSAFVEPIDWVGFVNYTASEEYEVKSAATKAARSKSVYQHTMGWGGYIHIKEKMIKNNDIKPNEEPQHAIMWLKGRQNKAGEFPNDVTRFVGAQVQQTEEKIKDGTMVVDQGNDAITVVFGKEKGGYARRVGSGVAYKRYFDLPRNRLAADERVALLQSQLENERRERQQKKVVIENLSNEMAETKGMLNKLMSQLAEQGATLHSFSTQLPPSHARNLF